MPKDSKELYISFIDPRGFIADEERIQLQKEKSQVNSKSIQEFILVEKTLAWHINSENQRFIISKESGIITSAFVDNKLVLEQGPVFGIVPMNNENGGKPNVANSTYQNNINMIKDYPFYTLFAENLSVEKFDNGEIFVKMDITYKEGHGEQTYLFKNDGVVEIAYKVIYGKNQIEPRQYGMIFKLPKSMEKLSWERTGGFSTYPNDDISRNHGTSLLNARHLAIVEPIGEKPAKLWKDEANDLGSRDFRSTRSNIKWVRLQNDQGHGVLVQSDNNQASRCWLQDERIQLLIADYNNGGAEPFYGGLYREGRIEIKKGHVIEGKINFSLY